MQKSKVAGEALPRGSALVAIIGGCCLLSLTLATRAQAPLHPGLQIVNHTKSAITQVYAKPSGSPKWGSKLADAKIPAGNTQWVKVPSETNCSYDMRFVYADGHEEERAHTDICQGGPIVLGSK